MMDTRNVEQRLRDAGLLGLAFSWGADGAVTFADDVPDDRRAAISAAVADGLDAEPWAAALAAIDRWRDEQEASSITFEHGGRTWDGGLKTRTRLQPVLSLPELPPGFFWTDAANNDVPVTLAELQALHVAHEIAIVQRGFQIHARQRQMKAEVAALQTPDDVRAYVVGWPDEAAE